MASLYLPKGLPYTGTADFKLESTDQNGLKATGITDNLRIVSVTEADIPHMQRLFRDSDVSRRFGNGKLSNAFNTTIRVRGWIDRWKLNNPYSGFSIFEKKTENFVGHVELGANRHLDYGSSQEGYAKLNVNIFSKFFHSGYITESLTGIVKSFIPLIQDKYTVKTILAHDGDSELHLKLPLYFIIATALIQQDSAGKLTSPGFIKALTSLNFKHMETERKDCFTSYKDFGIFALKVTNREIREAPSVLLTHTETCIADSEDLFKLVAKIEQLKKDIATNKLKLSKYKTDIKALKDNLSSKTDTETPSTSALVAAKATPQKDETNNETQKQHKDLKTCQLKALNLKCGKIDWDIKSSECDLELLLQGFKVRFKGLQEHKQYVESNLSGESNEELEQLNVRIDNLKLIHSRLEPKIG